MAAPWIKVRTNLFDDPRVVRIAGIIAGADAVPAPVDSVRIVGALVRLWCLADTHSTDGRIPGYSPAFLDATVGIDGFTRAVEAVGWLKADANGLRIPRFRDHNGASAKRRALEADRKRRGRAGRKTPASEGNTKRPRVRKASASDADELRHRDREQRTAETEKRGEKKSENSASAAALPFKAVGVGGNGRGRNPSAVNIEILQLMADRGCDESLRGVVAKGGDVQIVRQLATEYDRGKDGIENPGGWWRDRLRRAGMEFV